MAKRSRESSLNYKIWFNFKLWFRGSLAGVNLNLVLAMFNLDFDSWLQHESENPTIKLKNQILRSHHRGSAPPNVSSDLPICCAIESTFLNNSAKRGTVMIYSGLCTMARSSFMLRLAPMPTT